MVVDEEIASEEDTIAVVEGVSFEVLQDVPDIVEAFEVAEVVAEEEQGEEEAGFNLIST